MVHSAENWIGLAFRGQKPHFCWCTERKKERKMERNKLQQNFKPRAMLWLK